MTTQQIGRSHVKQLKLSKMAFKWNVNPSGTNIYVDKDGNDSTGNGTSSNPYKSIAKATSVGTSGNNIILGNGVWGEQRTLNNRAFNWWGNGMTEFNGAIVSMVIYSSETFNYFSFINMNWSGLSVFRTSFKHSKLIN